MVLPQDDTEIQELQGPLDEGAILIVEDEVHIREPLGMLLEQKGFSVELAEDGEQGLAKLREHPFFLVISDISMPRMDGLELLARIKEIRPGTDVVMITGNVEEDYAITALKRAGTPGVISLDQDPVFLTGFFYRYYLIEMTREKRCLQICTPTILRIGFSGFLTSKHESGRI